MAGETPSAPMAPASPAEAAVGAALDELRTFRVRLWAPVLIGLIMLFDSWDSIAIAYVMPSLVKQWGLTPTAMGAMISSGYFGQFVGAALLGGLAERVGRSPVFVFAVLAMGLLALACALAPSYDVLLAIRFIQGIAIGGALPVAITYVNELAPTKTRGRYFALYQWISMSGYAAASLSSAVIIPHLGWRWLFGVGMTPLLLLPLAMATLPESPRWLARIGRLADANKALVKLGGAPVAITEADSAQAAVSAKAPSIPITRLFDKTYLPRTAVIISLWFVIYFATFGLTTWAPSIYVTVFKIPVATALKFASIGPVLFLVVTPIMAVLMDNVGRRPLAMIGTGFAATGLLTLALHPPTETNFLVGLVIMGSLGISCASLIVWPYTAESYPTPMRAMALGICSSTARGASMLTPLFVGVILSTGGSIRLVFGVFGAFALIAFLMWWKLTRETARLSLESV